MMTVMIMLTQVSRIQQKGKWHPCRQMYLQVQIKLLYAVGFFFCSQNAACLLFPVCDCEAWSRILIYRDFCFQPAWASFFRLSTPFAQTWRILLAKRKIEKFPKSPLHHHSFPFRIYYGVLSWIRLRGKGGVWISRVCRDCR